MSEWYDTELAGSIVGAGLGMIGGNMAAGSARDAQYAAHLNNVVEADKHRTWLNWQGNKAWDRQKWMFDHAVTARAKDMQRAGINPILAGMKPGSSGAPAMPSGGGTPSASSAGMPKYELAMAAKMGALVGSEIELNTAKAEAERAKAGIQPALGDKYGAETELAQANVDKAKSEAKYKDAQTEGVLMDNVKKANLANVYDDAFGQVLTYVKEIGIDKALALGAIMLGPAMAARFFVKRIGTGPALEKIKALGNRFWTPGARREWLNEINKLRGK